MTHDPFLDPPELDEAGLELEGCAAVLLALFGIATILGAFAVLAEVLR